MRKALDALKRFGFVQVDNALSAEVVAGLRHDYERRHTTTTEAELKRRSLRVGEKRYMITVEISGAFNDPLLYANPCVFPMVSEILGGDAVLDNLTVVSALPGAAAQHIHIDHPPLFAEGLTQMVPCYAVTLVVPLVDPFLGAGATAAWLGSHRNAWTVPIEQRSLGDAFVPQPRLGSVYMMDFRLVHAGAPNTSAVVRPIICMVYSRPWFTDCRNFSRQARLRMSAADLAGVPEEFRPVLARASGA